MKVSQILQQDKVTLSLEVFPPKTSENYEKTAASAKKIAARHPDFMSVTYGAGGGTGTFTASIAASVMVGAVSIAHRLPGVGVGMPENASVAAGFAVRRTGFPHFSQNRNPSFRAAPQAEQKRFTGICGTAAPHSVQNRAVSRSSLPQY